MNKLSMAALCVALVLVAGCRWQDDFRDRKQPQLLEEPIRPTLNPDSRDYMGDDTGYEQRVSNSTPLPNIDELSRIPELPEYPVSPPVMNEPRILSVQPNS